MNKLNLGCGNDIKEGYINLDVVDYGGNQIHDLNSFPYPFEDNTFDFITCYSVIPYIEKIDQYIFRLSERLG